MVKAFTLWLLAFNMCVALADCASLYQHQQQQQPRRHHRLLLQDGTSSSEETGYHYHHQRHAQHQQRRLQQQRGNELTATTTTTTTSSSSSSNVQIVKSEPASAGGEQLILNNATTRNERSAAAGAGAARKVQFFIKNFHLQILPDGTVNGTHDGGSVFIAMQSIFTTLNTHRIKNEETIFQRTAIGVGKLKIQGVGTCQYLCMDACGLLYGSRDFSDECVLNEIMREHRYNTYSSTKYSNDKRTLYLALGRLGAPRKVRLHAGRPLGHLSSYTRVLPRIVPVNKLEDVLRHHPMRHHHGHACPTDATTTTTTTTTPSSADAPAALTAVARCRRTKKRRKRKRKCPPEGDAEGCAKFNAPPPPDSNYNLNANSSISDARCEPEDAECQRVEKKFAPVKKTKNGIGGGAKKTMRKRLKATTTTTEAAPTEEVAEAVDDDYALPEATSTLGEWGGDSEPTAATD